MLRRVSRLRWSFKSFFFIGLSLNYGLWRRPEYNFINTSIIRYNGKKEQPVVGRSVPVVPGRSTPIGRSRLGTILRANGRAVRYWLGVLESKKTLVPASYDDPLSEPALQYSEPAPGLVRLEGAFEGAKTIVLLRREPDTASLLMTRGFHWINELPLNR